MFDRTLSQGILYDDNSIQVFENAYALDNPWGGGLNAGQFGMIDFSGDGIKDLVVYDRTSNMINTFMFDNGRYIYSPQYRVFFPGDLYGYVIFRDFDGDGNTDIFTDGDQGMKAYRNISTPGSLPSFEIAADPLLTLTNSGLINLQVNYTDIPAIDDVDGDGDLDILVYNFAIGLSIRYHRNMSVENYGDSHALDFKLVDREWGQFEECNCHKFAFTSLGEICDSLPGGRVEHIGGKAILLIDMNEDGVKDLLAGHELCNELYYFQNKGTTDTALMTSFSEYFPDTINRANFPVFPAGYYDDFDNDGIKDLVVSPNDMNNLFKEIDYQHSAWFYKNNGRDDKPEFQLMTKSFLQENMIDLGENAVPALHDIDMDGDLDLLIAGNGFYSGGNYYGYVRLYLNTGSASIPEFSLQEDNYLDISSLNIYNPFIAFADFNSDGASDLLLSAKEPATSNIISRIFYNNAPVGHPAQYSLAASDTIDLPLSNGDTPCFVDVDGDGLVDMLLGKNTGRLDYYRNMGNDDSPLFILDQNDFLGIVDSYVEFRHNLVPYSFDVDLNGHADLVTTDYLGDIFIYWDYQVNPKKEQVQFYNNIPDKDEVWKQGYQTWIAIGSLLRGKFPVFIFGNKQGGVSLFRQELPGFSPSNKLEVKVSPNPLFSGSIIDLLANQDSKAVIFTMLGQPVSPLIQLTANRSSQVDLVYLPQGMYFVKFTDLQGRAASARIIKLN